MDRRSRRIHCVRGVIPIWERSCARPVVSRKQKRPIGRRSELGPQASGLHAWLSQSLLAQGRGEEALAEALREPEEWARLTVLAIIHHAEGHGTEPDAALAALIAKHHDSSAYQIGQIHSARGETELAFQWLERAYRQRDPGLTEMKCDPALRGLHADPRWEVLLCRMGLAD